ncbi:precorrin-2 dehydrogenase/sirohydrochlorin ferrochelatase family protein [Sandaracinobacteroides saxicola]|uniref:precorrin-2 dehydrogenase n=1 Tax=Sandaracinobacteroides saxicola TaxID=2759707 RepID=A0A7G5IIU6_9SPHN|nr:bifunctional precorrin-2 dehydrogenase/sirohydrochlorin ferrochelatase [Sandaracinobacteroides saxicola]QMW23288.1 siroheme synthase [Sandaracinobacteroides saxicola]
MESLPLFHRLRGQTVLLVGEGDAADAKRRLIEDAGGVVMAEATAATRLAFVAIDDRDTAAAVATRLKARGLLVNVVDQPALCDFTVPAIVDRSPVLVAIGTGGASASLSKALKERLERLLPGGLGTLATAILAARDAVAAVHRTVPARRAFWSRLLADGAALDPLRDSADAPAAIAAALSAVAADPADSISEIPLPASAEDLTLRQLRLLAQADLVVHPADCPADVLALVRRDAARITGAAPPAGARGHVVILI